MFNKVKTMFLCVYNMRMRGNHVNATILEICVNWNPVRAINIHSFRSKRCVSCATL